VKVKRVSVAGLSVHSLMAIFERVSEETC